MSETDDIRDSVPFDVEQEAEKVLRDGAMAAGFDGAEDERLHGMSFEELHEQTLKEQAEKGSPAGFPFNTEDHTEQFMNRYRGRMIDKVENETRAQAQALQEFFSTTRKVIGIAKALGLKEARIDAVTGEISVSLAPADV